MALSLVHWYIPTTYQIELLYSFRIHNEPKKIASGYAFHFPVKSSVNFSNVPRKFLFFPLCFSVGTRRDTETRKERSLTLTHWESVPRVYLIPTIPIKLTLACTS